VALQKLPVIFCLDRAGLVGEDGATHHGVFDISLLRSIPNICISSPLNEIALRNLLYTAQFIKNQAMVIRYPRGRGVITDWQKPFERIEIGKAQYLQKGQKIAVLSFGPEGQKIIDIQEELIRQNILITHVDMLFIKPLDEVILDEVCKAHQHIITLENGMLIGGLATAVAEFIIKRGYPIKLKSFGIEDRFIEHGSIAELEKECGIDKTSILEYILKVPHRTLCGMKVDCLLSHCEI
jgi:1-deoxy-D-xylulose-5-phosphate synthase